MKRYQTLVTVDGFLPKSAVGVILLQLSLRQSVYFSVSEIYVEDFAMGCIKLIIDLVVGIIGLGVGLVVGVLGLVLGLVGLVVGLLVAGLVLGIIFAPIILLLVIIF